MGGINAILEPVILIFKTNTNKISIHIDVEFHKTIPIPCGVWTPTKYL